MKYFLKNTISNKVQSVFVLSNPKLKPELKMVVKITYLNLIHRLLKSDVINVYFMYITCVSILGTNNMPGIDI